MAIKVDERFNGRRRTSGVNPGMQVDYILTRDAGDPDVTDNIDLIEAVVGVIPQVVFDPITFTSIIYNNTKIVEQLDTNLWIAQATWGSQEQNKKAGDFNYTFETTGATQKIFQSIKTTGAFAPNGQVPPDNGGAIGVTDESVEGCEITVPQFSFSETHVFADSHVTEAYKGVIYSLTGSTNTGQFRGCAPGEGLFLGAGGTTRTDGNWEVTFKFAANPNVTGLTIGNINGIKKGGWEYLWVRYQKTVVGTGAAKVVSMVPQAAYTEQVYKTGNFSLLGL